MGRSPSCNDNNTTVKKGPWTPEEDHKLIQYVHLHGPGNWRNLPKNAGLKRCGKSCRLRWTNYLRPDIKRGRFSFEEEEAIIQLHSALGNKWSAIASRLPGRTDNEIKNYWNTHIRKRLLKMGIDPVTHSPRLDLADLSNALNSAQLNYSNLLSLHSLVNPELLNLVTSLLASNQENQAFDHTLVQNMIQQPSQFQNCSTSSLPHSIHNPFLNQTQPLQGGDHHQVGDFEPNAVHLSSQTPDDLSFVNLSNNGWVESGHQMSNLSKEELVAFGYNNQNYGVDSVVSTTDVSSPTQLNSSSTFVNGSTEDERESYCSSLLKFEFPDSLDFSDFIM